MKQLIQYFKTGELELIETPVPKATNINLVIESQKSLISVGTEKMLLNFGKASMLRKAKQQPDKVKQVLNKIKTDGLLSTMEAVWSKLNEPIPLGYSNVGIIHETGSFVTNFKPGDKVVSNGPHSEFVMVPHTLAAKIPESINDEDASFAVLGSIAMQGWRLLQASIGETVVVIGLGLLGQLTMQIAAANGCRPVGFDIDESKIKLAKESGFDAFISGSVQDNFTSVSELTKGIGADGVIITASTSSEEILSQAAMICRQRGKIVLVGVAPINVPRNLFYEKELSFQVSSSYGPGRYDPNYEEKGIDYPIGFVRWTAQRNMQSFLYLLEQKKIDTNKLITHRFRFEDVIEAYQKLDTENPLGVIIEYAVQKDDKKHVIINDINKKDHEAAKPVIGVIGAGNFAKMIMLPGLKSANAQIKMISSVDGLSASIAAKKFQVSETTSDNEKIFNDNIINTVFIATRHNSHAAIVTAALKNNKNVFVEKPLALNISELKKIYQIIAEKKNLHLMVGFNRRFAPVTQKLVSRLENRVDPLSLIITINAGSIPLKHWVHDPETGGGRILGEGCHFLDLARYIIGHPVKKVSAMSIADHSQTDEDKVMVLLSFEDGSHAALHYLANGHKTFPKERVEVFSSEKVFVIDNFKTLTSFGDNLKMKGLKQDKGHNSEFKLFLESIENGLDNLIPLNELFEVHLATMAINISVVEKRMISMSEMWEKLNS